MHNFTNHELIASNKDRMVSTPAPSQILIRDSQTEAHSMSSLGTILIAMNTVGRRHREDYLLRTLRSIQREKSMIPADIDILIMNPHATKRTHPVFEQAKKEFQGQKEFMFEEADTELVSNMRYKGHWRITEPSDVQQNRDILNLLTRASQMCREHVLLMEDDFEWCPNSHYHLSHILRSVDTLYGDWGGGRVSFGMNGVLLKCADLMAAHQFLKENILLGPADSMLGIFWSDDQAQLREPLDFPLLVTGSQFVGRTFWVYRYNIFNHIGEATSREGTDFPAPAVLPRCYDIITMNGVMPYEMFDMPKCGSQDFSPCPSDAPKVPSLMAPAASLWATSITQKLKAIHVGQLGEPCSLVCSKVGRECVVAVMPLINNCDILSRYFTCNVCDVHPLSSNPNPYRNPGWVEADLRCMFSATPDRMGCSHTQENVKPLCPCL